MKSLLLVTLFCIATVAQTQLTEDSSIPLQSYNHKPALPLKQETQLKINALDAEVISKEIKR